MPENAGFWELQLRALKTNPLIRFLASLKVAVVTMTVLALVLAVGTFVESRYNADMARLVLYETWWFRLVLVFLFFNIALAVVVRIPLKPIQYGFAVVHAGLLILMGGAMATQVAGIDGSLELAEGQSSLAIRMPNLVVRTYMNEQLVAEAPVRRSLGARQGRLLDVPGMVGTDSLEGDVPHVIEVLPFSRNYPRVVRSPLGAPILEAALLTGATEPTTFRLALDNPMLSARQDLGLMAMSLERTSSIQAFFDTSSSHPGRFDVLGVAGRDTVRFGLSDLVAGATRVQGSLRAEIAEFLPDAQISEAGLSARSDSLRNPVVRLRVTHLDSTWEEILYGQIPDFRFTGDSHPGVAWSLRFQPPGRASASPLLRFAFVGDTLLARVENEGKVRNIFQVGLGRPVPIGLGPLQLSVGTFEPRGELRDSCIPIEPEPGRDMPPAAIRVSAGPWGPARWVPLGSYFSWNEGGVRRALSFEQQRLSLPFAVRLDRFVMGTDPGSMQAASYESYVSVLDSLGKVLDSAHIVMNEPLKREGFTLYQASFTMEPGQAASSVLSVNRDPGRPWKYLGSLLTILGIVWYTLARSRLRRMEGKAP